MAMFKTLYRFAVVSAAILVNACSDSPGNSEVGLEIPKVIREAQSVNQDAITATVIVGDRRIALTRNGDSFSGTITIASGTEISLSLIHI